METALQLLRLAAATYKPIADFLDHAVSNAPPEHQDLAARVADILPADSKSAQARRQLEAEAAAAANATPKEP
jgi:hypothetical protein